MDSAEPLDVMYELALARQRWSAVMQRSDEGIVLVDGDGAIVQHNQRFLELMHLPDDAAATGQRLGALLPRAFAELAQRLERGDDDFAIAIASGQRTFEVEGRTLRVPLGGRIETLVLVRDVSEQRQIAERDAMIQVDLEEAARFQRALLSRMRWPHGLDVDVTYRPLRRVGGDVYDVTVLPGGGTRLFIADATGHGVTAALSTMLIRSEYDAIKHAGDPPGMTLAALNDRITRTYERLAVMFTAAIVDISPNRRELSHASGGHPPPLLCIRGDVVELPEGGTFLGVSRDLQFPEWTRRIDGWRSIVLVTDGITEQRDAAGVQFGEDRLRAAIADAVEHGRRLGANVLARLDAFVDTYPQLDDLTLLAVQPEVRA